MSVLRILLISLFACRLLVGPDRAFAQEGNEGDVIPELTTPSKTATFKNEAIYRFDVKNTYDVAQEGTISYRVITKGGVEVKTHSLKVNIPKKSSASYNFNIAGLKSGFYKVNFMINVSYYDDTIRKAFGIRPEEIKSVNSEPVDFDKFWKDTRAEVTAIAPNFKMTLLPDTSKFNNRNAYLVEMTSLDKVVVKGYLTVPRRKGKFPVILGLPGYQVSVAPLYGIDNDLALFTLDVRGQGISRDVINTPRAEYIFHHIEDKKKYVMRGVIMDCIRAIDFICSRPELDHSKIMVSGGSMGGFLAIATAALDDRVKLCSAQNPIMSDVRNLDGEVDWPIADIQQYVKTQPGLTFEKVLDNLDYFDTKNFAPRLKCEMLLGMGLLDHLVPPNNAYIVYNRMKKKKHIIIFRDLGHEVGQEYVTYEGRWTRDAFGLF